MVQSSIALLMNYHAAHSLLGIDWTSLTAIVMFGLAFGKRRTGLALNNKMLLTEGRVTTIDALLAVAVLVGLVLNSGFGWWWADSVASYVLMYYAAREARELLLRH